MSFRGERRGGEEGSGDLREVSSSVSLKKVPPTPPEPGQGDGILIFY